MGRNKTGKIRYGKGMNVYFLFPILIAGIVLNIVACYGQAQPIFNPLDEKLSKKITLDLRDMDIVDVYKFLSLKGGFSVVVNKAVVGRVSLVLKNVEIKDALDIISIANGLGYKEIEDIVYVMPEQEFINTYGSYFRDQTKVKIYHLKYVRPGYALETLKGVKSEVGKIILDPDTGTIVLIDVEEKIDEMSDILDRIDYKLKTKVFPLSHADAVQVKEKLRERLDVKSVGTIEADERSNQIIVTALPERFEEVEPLIRALDEKTKEVLVKVQIIKVVLNPEFAYGIDWDKAFQNSESAALRSFQLFGDFSAAVDDIGSIFGRISGGGAANGEEDFTIDIKALKQVADTNVLANPTILVTNKQEASIHIGDKLAYVTTTTTGTGDDQTSNEEVHFVDTGILLRVTPIIGEDGYVRMRIEPEISSKSGEEPTPAGSEIPLINTTKVSTEVMVKDGTTIIIGGLHKDEQSSSSQGIPFLMDIPILGIPFRKESDTVEKTEIVIVLTPKIVDGGRDIIGYAPVMAPEKAY